MKNQNGYAIMYYYDWDGNSQCTPSVMLCTTDKEHAEKELEKHREHFRAINEDHFVHKSDLMTASKEAYWIQSDVDIFTKEV